ncbi:DUF4235 domain-containing protein [Bifidobacterium samirii]|uniref:Membrane associated protein n=1 Tax=Bifidobacterium samirii TaxID=2306974 RepID=A0A430FG00_9BIFI|nr:DUF4235 domain-containing protein [Bifidobacterium samirii]RSX51825.1 hypothetical protein D2E24_1852 [Bifidobacterium samirii]
MTDFQPTSSADAVIAVFDRINEKVDAMREKRLNDPDSLGDKLLKSVLPSLAGLVAGQLFTMLWNRTVGGRKAGAPSSDGRLGDGVVDERESVLMSILFAGLSAAFGAAVSHLSNRGSQALVDRRHRRRIAR